MKKILPIIALAIYAMACAPPKMANENNVPKNINQHDKNVDRDKQVAPGTCSLIITDCIVISKDGSYKLKGKVQSVIAYGAGFNRTLSKNDEITILISKSQAQSIKNMEKISCNILRKEGRYESAVLELNKVN
ncbi:hypothetical protein [Marinifilum sp. D714]|uniref:hypothetical protein n=1 Tax=Marinifilum sp. D714 TaxID=2937523 RepID=UPI0027BFDE17|nr:hypothetical protein [Marinifilum sp. D714]MDQ2178619.1 hypothetical protein [Marinifilum sp. D714]